MGQYQSATSNDNSWYTLNESSVVSVDDDADDDDVDEDNVNEDNVDEDNVVEDNVDEDNDDEQPRRVIPVTPGSGHFA